MHDSDTKEDLNTLFCLNGKTPIIVSMEVEGSYSWYSSNVSDCTLSFVVSDSHTLIRWPGDPFDQDLQYPGAYLAHFMCRFFQCSSGPPSQINMLYSNECIY